MGRASARLFAQEGAIDFVAGRSQERGDALVAEIKRRRSQGPLQNAVDYTDLGVATSSASLFLSMGGSLGTAALGAVFTARLTGELSGTPAERVSGGAANPAAIQHLPGASRDTYTGAFSDSLSTVFLVAAAIRAVRQLQHHQDAPAQHLSQARCPTPPRGCQARVSCAC